MDIRVSKKGQPERSREAPGPSAALRECLARETTLAIKDGAQSGQMKYLAWGEARAGGSLPTSFTYTGQRSEAVLGIAYFKARWYDTRLGRFLSPDSIIPNLNNPQSWDRYSYVRNNSINYSDPSGHIEACEENCSEQKRLNKVYDTLGAVGYFKHEIKGQFGITMDDQGGTHGTNRAWNLESLRQVYGALVIVDRALNGHLSDMIGGTTFWLSENIGGYYHGDTSADGIEFEVRSGYVSPYANIYHEIGHLLDAVPDTYNAFSDQLPANSEWINQVNKRVDYTFLLQSTIVDPVYTYGQDAVQDRSAVNYSNKSWEQWADTFSNYVASNIPQGTAMYRFVSDALAPFIGQ
jgi:RHS repeat-associated protein